MISRVLFMGALVKALFSAECPHEDPTLQLWSDPTTWDGKVPGPNTTVTIRDKSLLLDVETPRLAGLIIERSGRLVFSPRVPLAKIIAHYVLVRGSLEIGAKNCRFTGAAEIVLTGKIGEVPEVPDMGWKFLGVPEGGTLEIHGEERLSWTKITSTILKSSHQQRLNVIYDYSEQESGNSVGEPNGLWAFAFDLASGRKLSDGQGLNTDHQLAMFLSSVPSAAVVLFAIKGGLNIPSPTNDRLINVFEIYAYGKITGQSKLRAVRNHQAWAAIAMRGNGTEAHNPRTATVQTLTKQLGSLTYHVTSRLLLTTPTPALPALEFRVVAPPVVPLDHTTLDLLDDATSWRPGDQLVIASTDYDWKQAEVVSVLPCQECRSTQIKVKGFINYTHWGEITQNVDMRAEVALLTRNIKIHGEIENSCYKPQQCDNFSFDTFGGHIKIIKGFKNAHIQGAEIYHMGQQSFVGNYPIHFHLCEDVDDRVDPPYVRSNSLHHTFARCVTVHATHGLKVSHNVAYDHLGHCYFLEDGGEKRTVFDGNLAIGTRKAYLIPSDSGPASFWITNPLTYLRNNVAAGSEHSGIWYLFPEEPVVLSYGKGFMKADEARHTSILEFYNNVAHSNLNMGLFFEGKLGKDHSVGTFNNGYDPRKDPLDPNSDPDVIEFVRYTGYKNRMQNAWIRAGNVAVANSSFADSLKGLTFALGGSGAQVLLDSVIIGETANVGEPSRFLFPNGTVFEWPRSVPLPGICCYQQPVIGFVFNEGPVHLRNVWFDAFEDNPIRRAGALGYLQRNHFLSSPVSSTSNLGFGFADPMEGNRVFDPSVMAERGNTFRDLDGSVTGHPHTTVVGTSPFFGSPRCEYHSKWNANVCPHNYIKLLFHWNDEDIEPSRVFLTCDDMPEHLEQSLGDTQTAFQLNPERSYVVHFNGTIPKKITMMGVGLEGGAPIRIGICLPPEGTFALKTSIGLPTQASSLAEVDADSQGRKYFWDNRRGLLFMKMANPYPRTPETLTDCPGRPSVFNGPCPVAEVHVTGGDVSDGNCIHRAYPHYKTEPLNSDGALQRLELTRITPLQVGAGATRPFPIPPNA